MEIFTLINFQCGKIDFNQVPVPKKGLLKNKSCYECHQDARGSSKVVDFNIGQHRVPSISEEEQKFLGRVIFYSGKSSETLSYLKKIFSDKLENTEKTLIRPEYKLWIYVHYFLPSIRFLLTVHDVTSTNLAILDRLTHKFMKKWAGLPRCTTNAVFLSRSGLAIPSISSLYEEAHCVSHASTRLKGDPDQEEVRDGLGRERLQ